MTRENVNGLAVMRFSNLEKQERLSHFVSTRIGGISSAPYDSLNLSFSVGDDPTCVEHNRHLLCARAGLFLDRFIFGQQVHGNRVATVGRTECGAGATTRATALHGVDGLLTNHIGVTLAVLVADCVPLVVYDPKTHAVAVVHAGRRGTLGRIAQKAIEFLRSAYGTRPPDVVAGIGPSISPVNYLVDQDTARQVREEFPCWSEVIRPMGRDSWYLDLWELNRLQLLEIGLQSNRVEVAGLCTKRERKSFFSERAGKPTGRFAAIATLL